MIRKLAAPLSAALLIAACGATLGVKSSPAGPPRCAETVAAAQSSPNVAVPGAFACLSASEQALAVSAGITDDQTFATYAATDPVYTAHRYVGKSASTLDRSAKVYYYFEFTPQRCYRVSLDADGLVDGGGIGPTGAACPHPLP